MRQEGRGHRRSGYRGGEIHRGLPGEDADTAFKLLDRESQAEVGDKSQLVEGFSESIDSYSVGHPDISGDKAWVPLTLKLKAFESELKFNMILVTEDGAWRISLPESEAEMEKAMEELFKEIEPTR